MKSKKGSSAVFLSVILSALMSIAIALIYSVHEETVKSRADAFINLAGDSVLSEFDKNLYEEYGMFLLKGSDKMLSSKLYGYIDYSFRDTEDIEIRSVKVSGRGYSVSDPSVIKEQITEYMKIAEGTEALSKTKEEGLQKEEMTYRNNMPLRSLNHGPTIVSLPSALIPDRSLVSTAEAIGKELTDVKNIFSKGSDKYLISRYISTSFNNRRNAVDPDHFFRSEIEYILSGELSDSKNERKVERALKALRMPMNISYLYSNQEKQLLLSSAAQTLTPGIAAAATQAALTATWAYLEAENDVELLLQGYKVPIIKEDSTWAVEIESAVNGSLTETVVPETIKGYDYIEYLQIMLFFQEENIKLARILDLVQINMRAKYDRGFLISEYFAGISTEVNINGRTYIYHKKY